MEYSRTIEITRQHAAQRRREMQAKGYEDKESSASAIGENVQPEVEANLDVAPKLDDVKPVEQGSTGVESGISLTPDKATFAIDRGTGETPVVETGVWKKIERAWKGTKEVVGKTKRGIEAMGRGVGKAWKGTKEVVGKVGRWTKDKGIQRTAARGGLFGMRSVEFVPLGAAAYFVGNALNGGSLAGEVWGAASEGFVDALRTYTYDFLVPFLEGIPFVGPGGGLLLTLALSIFGVLFIAKKWGRTKQNLLSTINK